MKPGVTEMTTPTASPDERAERIRAIESELAVYHYASAYHVEWLLSELRAAQAEVERLRSLLDLPADCGLKTGNAPEITGKGIVWLKDYDELRAMRAVVDAARNFIAKCPVESDVPYLDEYCAEKELLALWGELTGLAAIDAGKQQP